MKIRLPKSRMLRSGSTLALLAAVACTGSPGGGVSSVQPTPNPLAVRRHQIDGPAFAVEAARLPELLSRGEFDRLDRNLEWRLRSGRRAEGGESALAEAYAAFPRDATLLPMMNAWADHPTSGGTHFALVVRGRYRVEEAWAALGGGWGASALAGRLAVFRERLGEARADLEKAAATRPEDPQAWAALVRVAAGLGLPRKQMETWFDAAIKADPACIEAYRAKLLYLDPRWHGSAEDLLDFARKTAEGQPAASPLRLLIADAHERLAPLSDRNYWQRPAVWEELRGVFEPMLSAQAGLDAARNRYARLAVAAGQWEAARAQFNLLGARFVPGVWGGSLRRYLDARAQALAGDPDARAGEGDIAWFVDACRRRLTAAPQDYELETWLGEALALGGAPSGAADAWEKGFAIDPQLAACAFGLGRVWLGPLADAAKSVAWYERGLAAAPFDVAGREGYERALLAAGLRSEAKVQMRDLLQRQPESPAGLRPFIDDFAARKDWVGGVAFTSATLAGLAPASRELGQPRAYLLARQGWFLAELGRGEAALSAYEAAAAFEPGDAWTLSQAALLLANPPDSKMKDLDRALRLAQDAVTLAAGDEAADCWRRLAQVYDLAGDPERAAAARMRAGPVDTP